MTFLRNIGVSQLKPGMMWARDFNFNPSSLGEAIGGEISWQKCDHAPYCETVERVVFNYDDDNNPASSVTISTRSGEHRFDVHSTVVVVVSSPFGRPVVEVSRG